MDFSDDDVSVSDGSEGDQGLNGVSDEEEDVDFSDVSEEPSDDATEPGAAAAAAGAGPAAAAAVAAAVAPSGARDVTQALISGEMSSQTALLQMEVGWPWTCPPLVVVPLVLALLGQSYGGRSGSNLHSLYVDLRKCRW